MTILCKPVELNWGIVTIFMKFMQSPFLHSPSCQAVLGFSQRALLLHAFFLSFLSTPLLLVLLGFQNILSSRPLGTFEFFYYACKMTDRFYRYSIFFHFSKDIWLALTDLYKSRL